MQSCSIISPVGISARFNSIITITGNKVSSTQHYLHEACNIALMSARGKGFCYEDEDQTGKLSEQSKVSRSWYWRVWNEGKTWFRKLYWDIITLPVRGVMGISGSRAASTSYLDGWTIQSSNNDISRPKMKPNFGSNNELNEPETGRKWPQIHLILARHTIDTWPCSMPRRAENNIIVSWGLR